MRARRVTQVAATVNLKASLYADIYLRERLALRIVRFETAFGESSR